LVSAAFMLVGDLDQASAAPDYIEYVYEYQDTCTVRGTCYRNECRRGACLQYRCSCSGCCDGSDCRGGASERCLAAGGWCNHRNCNPNVPGSCAYSCHYSRSCQQYEEICERVPYSCTRTEPCTKTATYRVYTPSVIQPTSGYVAYEDTLVIQKSADADADRWEWRISDSSGNVVKNGTVTSGTTLQTNAVISDLADEWHSVQVRHRHWRGGWSYWSDSVVFYRRANHAPFVPSIVSPAGPQLVPPGASPDDRLITIEKSVFADPDESDDNAPVAWKTQGGWELEVVQDGVSRTYSVTGTDNTIKVDFGENPANVRMRVRQRDAAGLWSEWSEFSDYEYTGVLAIELLDAVPNPVRRYERLDVTVKIRAPQPELVDLEVDIDGRTIPMNYTSDGVFKGLTVMIEPEGTYTLTAIARDRSVERQATLPIVVSGEVKPYIRPGEIR